MYAASKNYKKALELCVDRNISVTEEMAERLSIPKDEGKMVKSVNAVFKERPLTFKVACLLTILKWHVY